MAQKTIRLHPFETRFPADLDITCAVNRRYHVLQIVFRIHGNLNAISISPWVKNPIRRHRLWEKTCLECFAAIEETSAYWEFNFSPSGDWNVYHFDGYRQGMKEEAAFQRLEIDIRQVENFLSVECILDLNILGLSRQMLWIGPAAVIQSIEGHNTHWASVHPEAKPDFHCKDNFILKTAP